MSATRPRGDELRATRRRRTAGDWLLRGAGRLVRARYPERGPEIVATAREAAADRGAFAEAVEPVRAGGARRDAPATSGSHGALLAAVARAASSR